MIQIKFSREGRRGLTRKSWTRLRHIVKGRDKATCQYCGRPAPKGEVDHVLPLSRGGTDALDNLVWTCKDCNRAKGDSTLREWVKTFFEANRLDNARPRSVREFQNLAEAEQAGVLSPMMVEALEQDWEEYACND